MLSCIALWLCMCTGFSRWLEAAGLDEPAPLDAGARTRLRSRAASGEPLAIVVLGGGVGQTAPEYGQANLDVSDEMSVQGDRAKYVADRRKDLLLSATNGLDAVVKNHQLDAILFPGVASANIGARAGHPTVFVPYGFIPVGAGTGNNAFPAGFEPRPAPYGVSFTGVACSEPKLIAIAYAFEQATKKRVAPPLFP